MHDTLKKLKALQDLQNSQAMSDKLLELQDAVASLSDAVAEMRLTLSRLQMDFNRDHTKLENTEN